MNGVLMACGGMVKKGAGNGELHWILNTPLEQ